MTELILALGAGLLSCLSPCVLPLIPGYISYVSGKSLNELLEEKKVNIIPIVLFTVGFSLIFIAFGATSSLIGKILLNNSIELRILSGLVIIFFSLQIIGIINLNFLNFEKRFETQKSANIFSSVLVGMAFGFDKPVYAVGACKTIKPNKISDVAFTHYERFHWLPTNDLTKGAMMAMEIERKKAQMIAELGLEVA